jgi:hypothetical protein
MNECFICGIVLGLDAGRVFREESYPDRPFLQIRICEACVRAAAQEGRVAIGERTVQYEMMFSSWNPEEEYRSASAENACLTCNGNGEMEAPCGCNDQMIPCPVCGGCGCVVGDHEGKCIPEEERGSFLNFRSLS